MRPLATLATALVLGGLASCATSGPLDPGTRASALVTTMIRADRRELEGRPRLVEGKYARMARTVYDFYRGSMPLFRADSADSRLRVAQTRFDLPGVLPFSVGDAHPENFGLLLAGDGTLALEPNDLDAADRYPYQIDLRRLAVGIALSARIAGLSEADTRVVVDRCVTAYLATIRALARGEPITGRITEADEAANPILFDLLRRGRRDRDARAELEALTHMGPEGRRFLRGVVDPAEPEHVLADLPPWAIAGLARTMLDYRARLELPPAPEDLEVLDAVREHGTGVASWARIRVLVLVRGPSDSPDDDLVLEVKEEGQSGATGPLPPGVFADGEVERLREAPRGAWTTPTADPYFGAATWVGIPVQVRRESEAQKTFRTSRLVDERATPEALGAFSELVASLLARLQSRPALGATGTFAQSLDARVAGRERAFVEDEVEVALEHADVVEEDWQRFRDALRARGPLLGFVEADSSPHDLERAALYGSPPPVAPWDTE
ncbi:MAG: DUF2252 domain-containing protein [Sandaracinaceae bacterium]|nr:DUF2252 domain-containing protein [Sandaracinaceae bacterium]